MTLGVASACWMLASGCGQDSANPVAVDAFTVDSTTFSGGYQSDSMHGSITFVVPLHRDASGASRPTASTEHLVAVAGAARPYVGDHADLAGTYDIRTGVLDLAGGEYTFHGVYDSSHEVERIDGTWDGPGGPGSFGATAVSSNPL